jgi:uncharacterized membrane protein YcaP (DUF421 family)
MKYYLLKIEWRSILLGEEKWSFLAETALRSFTMFVVILLSLRMLGKRGIKQLSVFELGVIIGLGSAAGDPMFYRDVGLLIGMLVFVVVIGLYRLITFLINRSNSFERFVEGKPSVIVKNGCFIVTNFRKEPIAHDEFFAQLRLHNVSHLGQIKLAILETSGEVSIFYFADEDVKFGLPIIPELCDIKLTDIVAAGQYACSFCAQTAHLQPGPSPSCKECEKNLWVEAIDEQRIH